MVELIESKERILRRMTRRQWVRGSDYTVSPASNYSMVLEDVTVLLLRQVPRKTTCTQRFLARALRALTERPPAIDVRSSSSSRPHPELVCRFQSLNSRSLRTQSRLLSLSLADPATTKVGAQANESIRCGELGPLGAEPEIGDIFVRNAAAGSTHRHERLACVQRLFMPKKALP